MVTLSLNNVAWSPEVSSHFEVLRLKDLLNREQPEDHDPLQPHRLTFHALILFTEGQGKHGIDFIEYPVKAGSLVHICANQIHHFGQSNSLDALMVVFRPAVLPTNLLGLSTSISSPLSWSTIQYVWPSVVSLEFDTIQLLKHHIELLDQHQKSGVTMRPAAQYLLWSTISLASQAAVESERPTSGQPIDPRFLEFVELLEESFEFCRNVTWYAKQMNCSAKTLGRICMAAVGKSPKVIADERVVIEAQRSLLFGNATVKAVGASLGFEETTNFIKFFKRLVGKNPDQFRNKARW